VPLKERPHTFSPLITPNPLKGTRSYALLEVPVRVLTSLIALPPPLTSNLHGENSPPMGGRKDSLFFLLLFSMEITFPSYPVLPLT
jgi:hypothetical protein